MLKNSKFMLIHQNSRARCRYIIYTICLSELEEFYWIVDPMIFRCLTLSPSWLGVWLGPVGPILLIFSFYNSLIRWARVGCSVGANMILRTGAPICQVLSGQASFHRTITGNNRYKLCLCLAKQTFILLQIIFISKQFSFSLATAACKIFCYCWQVSKNRHY